MRSKRRFKKFLRIYIIVIVVLILAFLGFVYYNLVKLEKNQPQAFVVDKLSNLSNKEIDELFSYNPEYEKESKSKDNIRKFFKSDKYKIKKIDNLVYGIYLDDELKIKISLKSNKRVNLLGLITYDKLEVSSIEGPIDKALYSYEVIVPSTYEVKLNDKTLTNGTEEKIAGFLDGYDYAEIPKVVKYDIKQLTYEPDITITKNGETIEFEKSSKIDLSSNFKSYSSLEDANINYDVLTFAKNWSLFLTNDLSGTLHGVNTITAHLIKGTSLYKKAYDWATNVDITFTSKHTLKNPTFTNVSLSNVVVYSDNAFSCDVYLEKNMVVAGKDKTDTLKSTFYFVKYNNEWKAVNIKGA